MQLEVHGRLDWQGCLPPVSLRGVAGCEALQRAAKEVMFKSLRLPDRGGKGSLAGRR